ncbi:MAG: hypothetical protein KAS13_04875 [Candidatus Omnitrophica bacterium]|nr:hypothetical protein [Candidatus Omnitrophota bacterium]
MRRRYVSAVDNRVNYLSYTGCTEIIYIFAQFKSGFAFIEKISVIPEIRYSGKFALCDYY